jgi:hypothetical protein
MSYKKLTYALLVAIFLSIFSFKITHSQQPCLSTYSNRLGGVCANVNECIGAALVTSNCTALGEICCITSDDAPPNQNEHPKLTKQVFFQIVDNTTRNNVIYFHIVESIRLAALGLDEFKIAAFLAQIIGETSYFRKLESGIVESNETDENYFEEQFYQPRGGILLRGKDNYELANLSRLAYGIFFKT